MSLLVPVLIFFAAILLQALFSGYETGFVSANPIRIRFLAEEEHSRRAARLLRHIKEPDSMLTTLLIGTNVSVVISTLVVSSQVTRLLPPETAPALNVLVSTAIVAPIMLIASEIVPKSVFRTHPSRLSLALFPVMQAFYVLLFPLASPIAAGSRLFLRVRGGGSRHISPFMASLEEVRVLVDEGADHGTIEPEEQEMIHSVIDLQSTQAKEIMVPRIHVQALPDTTTRQMLVNLFEETGRTRVPIYSETIDEIIGVVNVFDLILDEHPEDEDIRRFIRPVIHVLETLKDSKQYLAIVTDEYGGTDGLVTIEDILEEIFGEIQDEYDREESPIQKIGPNTYVVDGLTPLDKVFEVLNVPLQDETVETIGGWLMHVAGCIPAPGAEVLSGRFRTTVLEGTSTHIAKIRLEVLPEQPGRGPDTPPTGAKESKHP
jgi:CBS domain containing-hemolysin-like protein